MKIDITGVALVATVYWLTAVLAFGAHHPMAAVWVLTGLASTLLLGVIATRIP